MSAPRYTSIPKRLFKCFFLLLLAILPTGLLAQIDKHIHISETEQLTIVNGLPSNTIFSLKQDKLGFVWTGSPTGLGVLDGYNAGAFQHPDVPNLALDRPGNIYIDNQNRLWIGSWGKGLKALNSNRTRLLDLNWTRSQLAETKVQTIYQSTNGNIWVGTFNHGLFMLDMQKKQVRSWQQGPLPNGLNHNRVWKITEDSNRNIWVATSNGLNKIDAMNGAISSYYDADSLSVADKMIRGLMIEGDTLWFGTNLGIFNLRIDTGEVHKVMPPGYDIISVNRIYRREAETVWIATFSGLFCYDLKTRMFIPFEDGSYSYIAQKDVRDIVYTERDVLLLATRYSGIFKLNLRPKAVQQIDNTLYSKRNKLQIWEMDQDGNGNIWAGTNDGVMMFSMSERRTLHLPSVLETSVKGLTLSVAFSKDKRKLWIGTINQLFQYDMYSGELISLSQLPGLSQLNHIRLLVDRQDNLWINSAHQGVFQLTPQQQVRHYHQMASGTLHLPGNNLSQLAEGPDGKIWLVTEGNRLFYKSPNEDGFTPHPLKFGSDKQQLNFTTTSLYVDSQNQIFIGTYSGLLKVNASTGRVTRFTIAEGLANNEVRAIRGDEQQNIWVSTGTGITRINSSLNDFTSFSQSDGLNSLSMNLRSIFNCGKAIMCFGSSSGINYIHNTEQLQDSHQDKLIIANLWINQEKQNFPATGDDYINLVLDNDERNLKFQFGKIDHRPNAMHEIYYRLRGFDEQWYASDISRIANYTNLQPGSYVFEVTDSPSHYQSHHVAKAVIEIVPSFWSRLWVKVIAALLVLSLAIITYRSRIRQVRSNEQKLNKLVEVRTQNMMLLGNIGMEITRSLNFQEIFNNLQKHLTTILAEHDFMLGLINEEKNALRFDLIINSAEQLHEHIISLSDEDDICVLSFRENQEFIISNEEEKHDLMARGVKLPLMPDGFQSCTCLPLQLNGKSIGVIFVRSTNIKAYGEYERQFLRSIAAYSAVALKNADFYQQQRRTHEKRISWLENITHYLNHEMKNSILGAQTSLNMLNRKIKDKELHKYVDRAEKSHKEMRNIMKAVSETTSLEASIMQASSNEFDISRTVNDRLEDYQAIYPNASIKGQITPYIFIKGNESLIIQCLDKLVNNAIEHHQQDTDIDIALELQQGNCIISISNIGDPLPDNIESIFDLFTSSKADASSGNYGMGLYVARLIADFHKGRISAQPLSRGFLQGARFELTIPIQ